MPSTGAQRSDGQHKASRGVGGPLARAAALAGSSGNPGRLHALVDTVRADRPLQRFLVKTPGHVYAVRADDVESLESAGHYGELRTATGTHLVRDAMAAMERRLDPGRFVRIHRSAIVNVDKVKELRPGFHGEFEVVLWSDRRLRCSRTYAPELTR